jgi:hypothetical protein
MERHPSINQGSHVIATFGGMGKTYFARKYPELAVDLEAVQYKYIYHRPEDLDAIDHGQHEGLKSISDRIDNPSFPDNYVREIVRNLGKYSFVLIVLSPETLANLEELDVGYSLVYPDYSAKEDLIERIKRRGNNDAFVSKISKLLSTSDEKNHLLKTLKPLHFFTLGHHEYLEDLIRREFGTDFSDVE